jgi:hypothetical protein
MHLISECCNDQTVLLQKCSNICQTLLVLYVNKAVIRCTYGLCLRDIMSLFMRLNSSIVSLLKTGYYRTLSQAFLTLLLILIIQGLRILSKC